MTLLDPQGRKIKTKKPVLGEIATVSVRDMYSSYPSEGLTPERLSRILKEADQGDLLRQAELFEEMEEKDAHLGSVLQTRKLAVAGLGWEVSPASDSAKDGEVASFIKEALRAVGNFDEAMIDLLDAIGKGFSIAEIIWEIAEGRALAPELRWRHQRRFTFMGRKGLLQTPRLLTDKEPVYGEELMPGKFIIHRAGGRSGAPSRGGILRPCAWLYLFKNYTLKDWVIFNERFAMPVRIGKYAPGASEADRRTLKNAVFNLGSDAAAVISDSTVIEFLGAAEKSASSGVYSALVEFCDRSISKAVLGHAGSADSTPGRLGSEGEARDVRRDLLEADAKALSRTITSGLIGPLVSFNFGPETPIPAFRFHYEAEENLREAAETYRIVREMGIELPEEFILEKFGIPSAGRDKKGNKGKEDADDRR